MKDQFLPYDESLELKFIGFNEECLAHYYDVDFEIFQKNNFLGITKCTNSVFNSQYYVTAPLWQQAFDWFSDNKKLSAHIVERDNNVYWRIIIIGDKTGTAKGYSSFSPDRISARKECIKKLIEIVRR